jgi:hypothetical protein
LEGVALQELTGLPHFRLLKAAEMLHSDGWNDTHVMPFHEAQTDATSKHTNGFSLLWTKPPGNRRQLTCENEIEVSGKLFVVSIYIYICATVAQGVSCYYFCNCCLFQASQHIIHNNTY